MQAQLIDIDGIELHVAVTGFGPELLMLSGGPGNVQYLAQPELSPRGFRTWYPEPRGVGSSAGGPHGMARAIADLEGIRDALGIERWVVSGHSWGSDLAVRYALEHPGSVTRVIGIAGKGLHQDRTWSQAYEDGRAMDSGPNVELVLGVHEALKASFTEWIHAPTLWRRLADCPVPMTFLAAADDIRPDWPLRQLAALVPGGTFSVVPDVPHDFWLTHPVIWRQTLESALAGSSSSNPDAPAASSPYGCM